MVTTRRTTTPFFVTTRRTTTPFFVTTTTKSIWDNGKNKYEKVASNEIEDFLRELEEEEKKSKDVYNRNVHNNNVNKPKSYNELKKTTKPTPKPYNKNLAVNPTPYTTVAQKADYVDGLINIYGNRVDNRVLGLTTRRSTTRRPKKENWSDSWKAFWNWVS